MDDNTVLASAKRTIVEGRTSKNILNSIGRGCTFVNVGNNVALANTVIRRPASLSYFDVIVRTGDLHEVSSFNECASLCFSGGAEVLTR